MNKEEYIKIIEEKFKGKSKKILLKQVKLFFEEHDIEKNKYKKGDNVILKKDNVMHGIFSTMENFDYTVKNGFISTDFTDENRSNKICNSVGFWTFKEDILLKDYINLYSGFTITYTIGRGPEAKQVSELIPYHKFDEVTERINNDDKIWTYWGDKTKEVSFIPSLVSDKRQIAFILNVSSDYAKKMIVNDVWNTKFDKATLKPFLDYRYFPKFLDLRFNRSVTDTDRESAIMFGLPKSLIEGVFVGRIIEKDKKAIDHIKKSLPDCYICNLDGKVIIGNK